MTPQFQGGQGRRSPVLMACTCQATKEGGQVGDSHRLCRPLRVGTFRHCFWLWCRMHLRKGKEPSAAFQMALGFGETCPHHAGYKPQESLGNWTGGGRWERECKANLAFLNSGRDFTGVVRLRGWHIHKEPPGGAVSNIAAVWSQVRPRSLGRSSLSPGPWDQAPGASFLIQESLEFHKAQQAQARALLPDPVPEGRELCWLLTNALQDPLGPGSFSFSALLGSVSPSGILLFDKVRCCRSHQASLLGAKEDFMGKLLSQPVRPAACGPMWPRWLRRRPDTNP